MTRDIFGRERHRSYREDMGGVGSFMKDNRCLYIANIKRASNLEDIITRHFAEWGELETVKVVFDKAIAYVKYSLRCSAEFAKEAMQDQSLDSGEVLNVRWSNEDPNPSSTEQEEKKALEKLSQAVALKQQQIEPMYNYQGGEYNSNDYFPKPEDPYSYPNTDTQFETSPEQGDQLLQDWLSELDLLEYKDKFFNNKCYSWESIAQVDDYVLDTMGILNANHRKIFLEEANKLQQQELEARQLEQDQQSDYYYNYATYLPHDQYTEEQQQEEEEEENNTSSSKRAAQEEENREEKESNKKKKKVEQDDQ